MTIGQIVVLILVGVFGILPLMGKILCVIDSYLNFDIYTDEYEDYKVYLGIGFVIVICILILIGFITGALGIW